MRTEEEIKERLQMLNEKLIELKKRNYIYPVAEFNIRQFEAAIWYLNWVLNESEEG